MLTASNPIPRRPSSRSGVACVGRTSMARSPATGTADTTRPRSSGYSVGVPPPTYSDVNPPSGAAPASR
jgi:hypothetical protein